MSNRRKFLSASAVALLIPSVSRAELPVVDGPGPGHQLKMSATPVSMPALSYPTSALEPHISARTVELHYGTHHAGYFKRLVPMLKAKGWQDESLETVMSLTINDPALRGIYNNAGQLYNHNQYWESLSPIPSKPSPALQAAIERDFGSMDALQEALKKEANSHFASGWAWLASTDTGQLKVVSTHDADSPLVMGMSGLLVIDVWEHAYYLDRQAGRAAYTAAVVEKLLNWSAASAKFAKT